MPEPVVLCRCHMDGKTSMLMRVDRQLREYLSIQDRDVIAFRLVVIEGKRMLLGEKLPLWKVARFRTPQEPPVPVEGGG